MISYLAIALIYIGIPELQHSKIPPAKVVIYPSPVKINATTDAGDLFGMKTFVITSKKYGNHQVMIDDEDYQRVMKYHWNVYSSKRHSTLYVHSRVFVDNRYTTLRLHRVVMRITDSKVQIDHKDHNGLNNQKKNLRPCTPSLNGGNQSISKLNTSGFKGVHYSKNNHNWVARITVQRTRISLGSFANISDAAKAYNKAALRYFAQFSRLNKIPT
jgi:hypothetical protein